MINDSYGPLIHSLPLSLADRVGPTLPGDTAEANSNGNEEKRRAAVAADPEAQSPGGVGKGRDRDVDASSEDSRNELKSHNSTDYGFAHPAASRPQQTIWLPKDTLGLSNEEVAALREKRIDVSTHDAEMDGKGKVSIEGPPPDEESRA